MSSDEWPDAPSPGSLAPDDARAGALGWVGAPEPIREAAPFSVGALAHRATGLWLRQPAWAVDADNVLRSAVLGDVAAAARLCASGAGRHVVPVPAGPGVRGGVKREPIKVEEEDPEEGAV